MISHWTRKAGVVGVAGGKGAGGHPLPAAENIPAPSAGGNPLHDPADTVSGITYTLNGTDPRDLDQVAFTIAPTAANTVRAQLVSGGAWYACVNTAGSVTCDTTSPQATAVSADNLTVVAAD